MKKGRKDLIEKLRKAISLATTLDSCGQIPLVSDGRKIINEVIRELGS